MAKLTGVDRCGRDLEGWYWQSNYNRYCWWRFVFNHFHNQPRLQTHRLNLLMQKSSSIRGDIVQMHDVHVSVSSSLVTPSLYARSLPLNLTAWPYFWSLVISWSPCFTTSLYCLFLSSGLLVSMIPFPVTRSIVHGILSAAINFARSLGNKVS